MGKNEKVARKLVVDGSYLHRDDLTQYRVVDLDTGELLYESPPYKGGSPNVAEYLGIIHGMAMFADSNVEVYSDSRIALSWSRHGMINTKSVCSPKLTEVLNRAVYWNKEKRKRRHVTKKWDTRLWGENPADFGRKSGSCANKKERIKIRP